MVHSKLVEAITVGGAASGDSKNDELDMPSSLVVSLLNLLVEQPLVFQIDVVVTQIGIMV